MQNSGDSFLTSLLAIKIGGESAPAFGGGTFLRKARSPLAIAAAKPTRRSSDRSYQLRARHEIEEGAVSVRN